jgi:hypothetical protein
MKSAKSSIRKIYLSPESYISQTERQYLQRRPTISKFQVSSNVPDPFQQIDLAKPNTKLKPIVLKRKCSPRVAVQPKQVSILLPNISEDGKFHRSKFFLPNPEKPKAMFRLRSNDEKKRQLQRVLSDGVLQIRPANKILNLEIKRDKHSKKSTKLEISFGNQNESGTFSSIDNE